MFPQNKRNINQVIALLHDTDDGALFQKQSVDVFRIRGIVADYLCTSGKQLESRNVHVFVFDYIIDKPCCECLLLALDGLCCFHLEYF